MRERDAPPVWRPHRIIQFSIFLTIVLPLSAAPLEEPQLSLLQPPTRDLARDIDRLSGELERSGVVVGIAIEDLSGKRLYGRRDGTPFVLASNTKLFTTAAALLALRTDFRWRTIARLRDRELWIIGRGDATFHIIDGYSYPDAFLDETAKALKARKVRKLSALVIDGRYFDDVYQHPDWPRDQLRRSYAASVSGLPYARGLVRMRRGRSSIYAATFSPLKVVTTFLKYGLQKRGIRVEKVRLAKGKDVPPPTSQTIYSQSSPWDLPELIRETNRNSDNYLAEHLFKTLGAELEGEGSFDSGARAVRKALGRLDIPLEHYNQIDGSGLARRENGGNQASPATVAALLRAMALSPKGDLYVASLAVSGESGTLEGRLDSPRLAGHVVAKTGRISGSVTLSGYLFRDASHLVTFSILTNFSPDIDTHAFRESIYAFQDAVLERLWQYMEDSTEEWATPPPTIVQVFPALDVEPR